MACFLHLPTLVLEDLSFQGARGGGVEGCWADGKGLGLQLTEGLGCRSAGLRIILQPLAVFFHGGKVMCEF